MLCETKLLITLYNEERTVRLNMPKTNLNNHGYIVAGLFVRTIGAETLPPPVVGISNYCKSIFCIINARRSGVAYSAGVNCF